RRRRLHPKPVEGRQIAPRADLDRSAPVNKRPRHDNSVGRRRIGSAGTDLRGRIWGRKVWENSMLGLGSIARKVFGTPNDRMVKSAGPLVERINALEPEFTALTDAGIIAKTAEFKTRIANGESLDD